MHSIFKSESGQMSEAFITMFFLTVSGGLQDAYTYIARGGVFANAQTGNVILMTARLFEGDFYGCLKYLIPILAFALGIFVAENISGLFRNARRLHWRQIILFAEIVLLFSVAFIPREANIAANAIVSFSCAMQVQSFRKVNGKPFASTMCIGNLRSGMEALSIWSRTGEVKERNRAIHYLAIILSFAIGAGLGSVLSETFGLKTILLSCLLLTVSLLLMFIGNLDETEYEKEESRER